MKLAIAFLLVCAAALAASQLMDNNIQLYQRGGDGCTNVTLDTCVGCAVGNDTMYTMCYVYEGHGKVICEDFSDSSCTEPSVSSYYANYRSPCPIMEPCVVAWKPSTFLKFTVSSPSNVTIIADGDVALSLSADEIVAVGHLSEAAFASSTSNFTLETLFDDGTYLTSAGQCAFGSTCTAGDLSYMAETVSILPLGVFNVRLTWYNSLAISSWNSSPSDVYVYDNFVAVSSSSINDLILSKKKSDSVVEVANMELEDLDTDEPILYYVTLVDGKAQSFEYITCRWNPREAYEAYEVYESTPHTQLQCNLVDMISDIYVPPSSVYYDDMVEERTSRSPTLLQKIAALF